MNDFIHEPVMLREVLEWIRPVSGGIYCDGTLGGGGHSRAILEAAGENAALFGIDRDETAIAAASDRLKGYPGFHAIHGNFHDAAELLKEAMEGAMALQVPLVAEVHRGKNWYEAK